jgi:hypothetical protein
MGDLVGPEGVSGLPKPSIFDFGPQPVEDAQMNDAKVTQWAVERLGEKHEKPFFLAVGLITPHLPLFTPQQYYDAHCSYGKHGLSQVIAHSTHYREQNGRIELLCSGTYRLLLIA